MSSTATGPAIRTIAYNVIRFIWASTCVVGCTTLGVIWGYTTHGIAGAFGLGFVGFCAGAAFAISPTFILSLLS